MSTGYFTFDGNDLGALYGIYLEKRAVGYPTIRERSVLIPNRAGSHDFGSDIGERIIVLNCWVKATNRANLMAALANLNRVFNPTNETSGDLAFKKLIFDDESDRYYLAKLSQMTPPDINASDASVALTLRCADPFAYDVSQGNASGTTPVTFTAGGTYWTEPVIEIVASGSYTGNITITDQYGRVLTWNGSVSATDHIRVDCSLYRVYKNDVVSMSGLAASTYWPRVKPGVSNSIAIGGLTAITSTTVTYRNRWL